MARNKTGYMADIVELLNKMEINMSGLQVHTDADNTSHILMTIEIDDAKKVYEVMRKIRTVPNTINVFRMNG